MNTARLGVAILIGIGVMSGGNPAIAQTAGAPRPVGSRREAADAARSPGMVVEVGKPFE